MAGSSAGSQVGPRPPPNFSRASPHLSPQGSPSAAPPAAGPADGATYDGPSGSGEEVRMPVFVGTSSGGGTRDSGGDDSRGGWRSPVTLGSAPVRPESAAASAGMSLETSPRLSPSPYRSASSAAVRAHHASPSSAPLRSSPQLVPTLDEIAPLELPSVAQVADRTTPPSSAARDGASRLCRDTSTPTSPCDAERGHSPGRGPDGPWRDADNLSPKTAAMAAVGSAPSGASGVSASTPTRGSPTKPVSSCGASPHRRCSPVHTEDPVAEGILLGAMMRARAELEAQSEASTEANGEAHGGAETGSVVPTAREAAAAHSAANVTSCATCALGPATFPQEPMVPSNGNAYTNGTALVDGMHAPNDWRHRPLDTADAEAPARPLCKVIGTAPSCSSQLTSSHASPHLAHSVPTSPLRHATDSAGPVCMRAGSELPFLATLGTDGESSTAPPIGLAPSAPLSLLAAARIHACNRRVGALECTALSSAAG